MDYKNYSFYHGEAECPFSDEARCLWWRLECEAATNGDDKKPGELSSTMWDYLREKMWQGDAQSNTSESEFNKRARELYLRGAWSRSYLTQRDAVFPV